MSHWEDAFKASSNNIAKVVFRTCLKALTGGRDYKLTSWQESEFAQSHRLIAAVLAPQKSSKRGGVLCITANCCCYWGACHTQKRSRTSITGNPTPTNNL